MRDDREEFQPLGPAKPREPENKPAEWQPVPDKPDLERDADGKLRTNIPSNNSAC